MNRLTQLFLIGAGACDALTGLLLLAAPVTTLRLMMIPTIPAEPVYIQFIGAFVFAVGSSYFRPFLQPAGPARRQCVRDTLASTAWIRVCIASATGLLILRGALHPMWLVVTATDAVLASVQVAILRSRKGLDA